MSSTVNDANLVTLYLYGLEPLHGKGSFDIAQQCAHICHHISRSSVNTHPLVQEANKALFAALRAYQECTTPEDRSAQYREIKRRCVQRWDAMDTAHLMELGTMYFSSGDMTGSGLNADQECGYAKIPDARTYPECLYNTGMCPMCEPGTYEAWLEAKREKYKEYPLGIHIQHEFFRMSSPFYKQGGILCIATNDTLLTLLEDSREGRVALDRTRTRLYNARNDWVKALLQSLESDAWTMPRLSSDCYPALPGYGLKMRMNGPKKLEVKTVWAQQHDNAKIQRQMNSDNTLFRNYTRPTAGPVMQLVVPEQWKDATEMFRTWMKVRVARALLRDPTDAQRVLHTALMHCDVWFRSLLCMA